MTTGPWHNVDGIHELSTSKVREMNVTVASLIEFLATQLRHRAINALVLERENNSTQVSCDRCAQWLALERETLRHERTALSALADKCGITINTSALP